MRPAPNETASIPRRLDLLVAADRGLTRPAARALIEAGLVTVNGRMAKPGQVIRPGDELHVTAEVHPVARTSTDAPSEALARESGPAVSLEVVYEDEWLAVIDKPAGLVVHPAPGHPHGTLADGLSQRGSTWSLLGGEGRPGIVHRLDRDTSGLLVVAKSEAAHRALAGQLRDRSLGRTYWALVWGRLDEETGTVDAPVGRDPGNRRRMAVVDGGREAVTDFTVVERLPGAARLDVRLRSGRTHQIRVHLAWIGHPLAGDPLYGRRREMAAAGRPALHARLLSFIHPADGEARVFESPPPADLEDLLERIRGGG